jgi:hypothetical protein
MSSPASQLPRRRPIPQFSSLAEFKRVAVVPNATRYVIGLLATIAVLGLALGVSAYINREHPNLAITMVLGGATLVVALGFLKVAIPLLWRRLYDRVMQGGGMMCDVYPSGFPDEKTAILIDARMSDAQAAHVLHAIARWCSWMASNPSTGSHTAEVFADGPIRSAEELVGPDGRGGFLAAGVSDMSAGWRLVLPEAAPRDPRRPYLNGVVVRIKAPAAA